MRIAGTATKMETFFQVFMVAERLIQEKNNKIDNKC